MLTLLEALSAIDVLHSHLIVEAKVDKTQALSLKISLQTSCQYLFIFFRFSISIHFYQVLAVRFVKLAAILKENIQ